jgi:dolichyl-phosphate mannosyltransferase polypeptide 2 regulatory subunit
MVSKSARYSRILADKQATSDKLLGSAMLAAAAFVFTYYTTWALFLVCPFPLHRLRTLAPLSSAQYILPLCIARRVADKQPFLEPSNSLHNYFPAREWAVRLPAFLLLSGVGAIGLFFGKVMMNEARKKRGGGKKV